MTQSSGLARSETAQGIGPRVLARVAASQSCPAPRQGLRPESAPSGASGKLLPLSYPPDANVAPVYDSCIDQSPPEPFGTFLR
eukprot:5847466-Prymnesium_polylepis.1